MKAAASAIRQGTAFRNPIAEIIDDIEAQLSSGNVEKIISSQENSLTALNGLESSITPPPGPPSPTPTPTLPFNDFEDDIKNAFSVFSSLLNIRSTLDNLETHVSTQLALIPENLKQIQSAADLANQFDDPLEGSPTHFDRYYGILNGQFDSVLNDILSNLVEINNVDVVFVNPIITASQSLESAFVTESEPTIISAINALNAPLNAFKSKVDNELNFVQGFLNDINEKINSEQEELDNLPNELLSKAFIIGLPNTVESPNVANMMERVANPSIVGALSRPSLSEQVRNKVSNPNISKQN